MDVVTIVRLSNGKLYLPEFIHDICESALEYNKLKVLVGHVPDVGVDVESLHGDLAAVAGEHLPQPELLPQALDEHLGRVFVRIEDDAVVTRGVVSQNNNKK